MVSRSLRVEARIFSSPLAEASVCPCLSLSACLARSLSLSLSLSIGGPAVIHVIWRDACSDSIAKLFHARFFVYRTIIA